MKLTINIDNKWLQQQIDKCRTGDEIISAQELMHDKVNGPKLEKFLQKLAEDLLVTHLESGNCKQGVLI